MHKFSWAALLGQLVNVGAALQGSFSPHTALVLGGAIGLVQALLPSTSKTINQAAADQAAQH